MSRIAEHTELVDNYAALLSKLSLNDKLDLIARLSASVKSDLAQTNDKEAAFYKTFGAWPDDRPAAEIKGACKFRKI